MIDREYEVAAAQEAARGAKTLLESKTLQDAFARLEAGYMAEWRDSAPGQAEAREQAWHSLRALDAVRRDLQAVVEGGEVAAYNARNVFRR